ncbi:hypothetical protein DPMN_104952 [Dreissena polymorpha]|uniref:Uncharacterized protein n=1 Tax=Dreissena polymorpha TaxID=45954 RepID=A0A9D4K2Y0_DREPO|nr:hypothetical protein DPMN_104952 [Dreissena polymorpha]
MGKCHIYGKLQVFWRQSFGVCLTGQLAHIIPGDGGDRLTHLFVTKIVVNLLKWSIAGYILWM